MPKRMHWIYTCSLCREDFETKEKVASYTITPEGRAAGRALDVCAICAEGHLWRSIIEATYTPGKDIEAPASVTVLLDPQYCELCPGREFKNKLALGIHQRKAHGMVSETKEAARQRKAKAVEFPCTHPGCGRVFDKSAKLSGHTRWHKTTTAPNAGKAGAS